LAGQTYELPRELACRWFLMSWAECDGVTFTTAELYAAAAWALEEHELRRGNRGAPLETYWKIPAHRRFLERLDVLTRPAGLQERESA
jgi:hypothetical protein